MQPLYLVYMVVSGLAFASLDLIRKLLAGRIDALALVFFMSLGAAPFLGIYLAYEGSGNLSLAYLPPASGALVLNFAGSLGFIYSVKLSPLNRTVPLLSLTPVFTAFWAIPVLGQYPNAPELAGILLVVVGALALTSEGHVMRPFQGLLKERGSLIMMGVALIWSLSGPLDRRALEHASVPFHATAMAAGVGLGALVVLWLTGRLDALKESRSEVWLLLAAMLSVSAALAFQMLAIKGVLVSLVEAFKRSVGSVMAVVLGRLAFGEVIGVREGVAVFVICIGVFLILT
jgi:drug/metabolite transporter (DMT)-like permease